MPISVFCHVCNHGNKKNCKKKHFLMLIKEVVQKIFILGKLFETTGFYDNTIIKSAYIIELGNHRNRQNCTKVNFYTHKEGGNRNISFGKII